ncbi:hypothetical protein D8674_024784 [Pyrus ussuriensis x Pyrus communis]|uniref:Uncharacterized protein n=1 Tax=Pyrus ussuriensis x Pyrus communis TaxID=2448454 RepID=A0A5N5H909_9ROSA|nr:hypothetical protein D8674_024784 [Pyrus ussuriensis x Pyrus communis]
MTVGLMEAQEREACVESVLPSPSQTTEDSWESSRSVENNAIWVSKFDEILLDLWKPIVKYKFSHFVTTTTCNCAQVRLAARRPERLGHSKNAHAFPVQACVTPEKAHAFTEKAQRHSHQI